MADELQWNGKERHSWLAQHPCGGLTSSFKQIEIGVACSANVLLRALPKMEAPAPRRPPTKAGATKAVSSEHTTRSSKIRDVNSTTQ